MKIKMKMKIGIKIETDLKPLTIIIIKKISNVKSSYEDTNFWIE